MVDRWSAWAIQSVIYCKYFYAEIGKQRSVNMESGNIGTKMPSERQSIENLGISFIQLTDG